MSVLYLGGVRRARSARWWARGSAPVITSRMQSTAGWTVPRWTETGGPRGECMPIAIIVALDLGLLVLAARRPWLGLTILLAAIPFNGFLVDVLVAAIGVPDAAQIAVAGWHDALAAGIALSALVHFLRGKVRSLGLVEWLAVAMLAMGVLAIAVSPYQLTALYVYRTLYVPPVLALSLVFLWRAGTMPAALPERIARVIVGSGVAAALFAGWQVYVGGTHYLNLYFRMPDGRLPTAYFSYLVEQPRAFGPFHSPNEFGAYLGLAVGLLLVPGVLSLRPAVRSWLLVPIGLGLLLTLSRSAWVATGVVAFVTVILAWPKWSVLRDRLALLRTRGPWLHHGPPMAVFVIATAAILASSNASSFIAATLTGREPSAAYRADLIENVIQEFLDPGSSGEPSIAIPTPTTGPGSAGSVPGEVKPRISLLGMGLGTAGPKSARFGGSGSEPPISSETWYVNYLLQVGLVGLAILALFVLAIVVRLWRSRNVPWSRAAIAIGAGLAVGALAIPVVDEPAVALPLWSVLGLGLLLAERERRDSDVAIGKALIS